jgi:hypothetical protein
MTDTFDYPVTDSNLNFHSIGFEYNNIIDPVDGVGYVQVPEAHFVGFIYKLCFKDTATPNTDFDNTATCDKGYCDLCPAGPDCLINCDVDEFLNVTEDCELCNGICRLGCYIEGVCNGCEDVICEFCEDWLTCSDCITNAVLNTETEIC